MARKKNNPLLVWERRTGPDIAMHWLGEPGGFVINKQSFGSEPFTVQADWSEGQRHGKKNIGKASTLAEAKIVAECHARAPSTKKLKTKLLC